jgi:hypothetical protein
MNDDIELTEGVEPATTYPDSPEVVFSIPNGPTTVGCTVASGLPLGTYPVGTDIWLGWQEGTVGDTPSASAANWVHATVGDFGLVKHPVGDGTAGTQYIAQLNTDKTDDGWIGNPIAFKTLPSTDTDTPWSMTWGYGSCQYHYTDNPPVDATSTLLQKAWTDLMNPEGGETPTPPDIVWETGDFHYQGRQIDDYGDGDDTAWQNWAAMYYPQFKYLPIMAQARALSVCDVVGDDHEFSRNNGDSYLPPGYSGPDYKTGFHRMYQMQAMTNLFANPATASATGRGLYWTYMLGNRVRVIVTDGESLDRTPGATPDSPTGDKTFLGDDQTTWLEGTLSDDIVPLNLIISGKAWIGSDNGDPGAGSEDIDKIWAYPTWRQDFADWLTTWNSSHDEAHQIHIIWMGGDRHHIAWDGGDHNSWGGFPCLVGSGWSARYLQLRTGETYDYLYPSGVISPPPFVMQYARGTISDDAAGTITFTVCLRYLVPGTGEPYTWDMGEYASATMTFTYPV